MNQLIKWLRAHKFESHLMAFLLMVIPPAVMYIAAENSAAPWIWALLGIVVCGNLLVLFIK